MVVKSVTAYVQVASVTGHYLHDHTAHQSFITTPVPADFIVLYGIYSVAVCTYPYGTIRFLSSTECTQCINSIFRTNGSVYPVSIYNAYSGKGNGKYASVIQFLSHTEAASNDIAVLIGKICHTAIFINPYKSVLTVGRKPEIAPAVLHYIPDAASLQRLKRRVCKLYLFIYINFDNAFITCYVGNVTIHKNSVHYLRRLAYAFVKVRKRIS